MKLRNLIILILALFGAFYIYHIAMHHKGTSLNPLAG